MKIRSVGFAHLRRVYPHVLERQVWLGKGKTTNKINPMSVVSEADVVFRSIPNILAMSNRSGLLFEMNPVIRTYL